MIPGAALHLAISVSFFVGRSRAVRVQPSVLCGSAQATQLTSQKTTWRVTHHTSKNDELARCQDALRRMEEEIGLLRSASLTFGALADRLNTEVQRLRAELRARADAEAEQ